MNNAKAMYGVIVMVSSTALMIFAYVAVMEGSSMRDMRVPHFRTVNRPFERGGLLSMSYVGVDEEEVEDQATVAERFYESREDLNLSNLGAMLFLGEKFERNAPKNVTYKIVIWKVGPFLENRHIKSFSDTKGDPFESCSVRNCEIAYAASDDELDPEAHALIVHLHRLKGARELPDANSTRRSPHQRWIFLTDESPRATNMHGMSWRQFNGIFNWSMTYKMESDVPVPYGRTVPLPNYVPRKNSTVDDIMELVPYAATKRVDVLAAILVSNCNKHRLSYVEELSKRIDVHVYGGCGKELKNACPGHFHADCAPLRDYLFYLAFENSHCDEYITEKAFWNALGNGAVPVVMGAPRHHYARALPPASFLHVDDYARPRDLAEHLLALNGTRRDELRALHAWRRRFAALQEHGYFGSRSVHYCRACEALNHNDRGAKTYEDVGDYLDPGKHCVLTR